MAFYNLYPPVIDSYMPAFVVSSDGIGEGNYTGSTRIYFSLSKYNSIQDISAVWLSLVDTTTNMNVLKNKTTLKKFVKDDGFYKDSTKSGDSCYYIELSNEDIILNTWETGKYYKAQLRFQISETLFDENEGENITPEDIKDDNMSDINKLQNKGGFSEWSTGCLLYAITKPIVYLKDFSPTKENQTNGEVVLPSTRDNVIAGNISFGNRYVDGRKLEEEEEELESYKICFYKKGNSDESDSQTVFESEEIFTGIYNPNEINYQLFFGLEEGCRYKMRLIYTTKNQYVGVEDFSFLVLDLGGDPIDVKIAAAPYTNLGCIGVKVTSPDDTIERYLGNLTIRRTSNKSNFTLWEDVYHYQARPSEPIDFEWRDYYIESGVWYKYCIQKRDVRGNRGLSVATQNAIALFLEDMFISGKKNQHLRVQFNPQVGSYSQTKLDSITQTLGGKYPFIKRNADVGYRQFTISGLITHFMNEDSCFVDMEELRNSVYPYRDNEHYNPYQDMNINDYNDFALEKKFRDMVEEFLYDGEVKMFRSLPEGSMLVRLTNISFTPNQSLGRMIYSFSATVTEIDKFDFDTIEKYKLYSRGELTKVEDIYDKESYFRIDNFTCETDILKEIEQVEFLQQENQDYLKSIKYIKHLMVEFEGPPERVGFCADGTMTIVKDDYSSVDSDISINHISPGYIIKVNNKDFYIPVRYRENLTTGENKPYGVFQLKGDDLQITSVTSGMKEAMHKHSIGVTASFQAATVEDFTKIPIKTTITSKLGQLNNLFTPSTSIGEIINTLCSKKDGLKYEKEYATKEIVIEAEPNTVVYVRTLIDQGTFRRFLIGPTGILKIENPDSRIQDVYIKGLFYEAGAGDVIEKTRKELTLEQAKVIQSQHNGYLSSLNDNIVKRDEEDVVKYSTVNYKGVSYLYDDIDKVVIKPTFAMIDYYCWIEKGEYSNEI